MTKERTNRVIDRLLGEYYRGVEQRKDFERRFEEFVKDERAKQGHYEENEFGPECP